METINIQFLPYKIRKNEVDCEKYIIQISSEDIIYIPKGYNGVFFPFKNIIMLLGYNNSLDTDKWSEIVNHEVLHFVLYYFLGIKEEETSEHIVCLLEN